MIEIISTEKAKEDWHIGHLSVNGTTDDKANYYWESGHWNCGDPHKGIPEGLADEPCTAFPEKTKAWIVQQFPMAQGYLCNLQMIKEGNEFTLLIDYDIPKDENGDITDIVLNPFRLLKLVYDAVLKKGLNIEYTSLSLEDDSPGYFKLSHRKVAEGTIGQRVNELVEMLRHIEQEAMETLRQEARELLK